MKNLNPRENRKIKTKTQTKTKTKTQTKTQENEIKLNSIDGAGEGVVVTSKGGAAAAWR